MITIFETYKSKPRVGDYVICQDSLSQTYCDLNYYLLSHIGQIITWETSGDTLDINVGSQVYMVSYENVPDDVSHFFKMDDDGMIVRSFWRKEMIYWSPVKKDVERYLTQQRFDL